jgi:DNA-binding NarL/FixJ family response regulator
MIRVAVAADDVLFCEGVRALLASDPDLELVGYRSLAGLDELVEAERPDVLLVDSRMPGAIAVCARLRRHGGPRPVLYAAPGDVAWAAEAIEVGARGILHYEASPSVLAKAVRVVHEGQVWASHRVLSRIVEDAAIAREQRESRADVGCLSERERQVLRHASAGASNKEIAALLGISPATVKAHLTHVFQKLGLRDRVQLAANYSQGRPGSARETPRKAARTGSRPGLGS